MCVGRMLPVALECDLGITLCERFSVGARTVVASSGATFGVDSDVDKTPSDVCNAGDWLLDGSAGVRGAVGTESPVGSVLVPAI